MKKHEHPTNRLEKMSNFFGGGNFSKLNLYKVSMTNRFMGRYGFVKGRNDFQYHATDGVKKARLGEYFLTFGSNDNQFFLPHKMKMPSSTFLLADSVTPQGTEKGQSCWAYL